ncbi:sulfite reductase (NADPH) flavoprotein alpha-component [Acinetobacter marinus]|uniref:Sulfite reductase (NADPH) flavoprotein alpha-component n=2 Tax=Acinetobacter marinus TaxID=281375 RepID=A0A1G6M6J1_9GAMM|nr:sulfite reductase (NADPH) flavoprotein alpha-component [Acinetobacter marinus]
MGITAGLVLSIMGVTGAIYSYEPQILKWINQDSYVVQVPDHAKLTPAELYLHFAKQDPSMQINSITIQSDASASSVVNIAKEGHRRGYNMLVNPYTADVLPEIKGEGFFDFVEDLHRRLTAGEIGKQITGACVLMLLYFVFSGIYLRWPKKHSFRQWLFVKPKLKGRNFIWDLHAVVGTWVVLFYLVFAVTGLYWSYDWWRSGMFKVMGVERPQQGGHGAPQGGQGRPPQAQQATPQAGTQTRAQSGEQNRQRATHENRDAETPQRSPEQISTALTATWAQFPQQLNRPYSSMTLNLPQSAESKVDILFLDAEPQHERARNNATFNYANGKIEELELYADKKLNEKIMSSMLPVHRGNFMGGVYQFFAMLASFAMPLFFITGWMLYLKRRKQKRLTREARQGSNVVHLDPNAQPWTILYASQTGMAEQIAYNTSTALQQAGTPTFVKALKEVSIDEIQQAERVLLIASTYGTGDAPDLASNFAKKHLKQNYDFSKVKFAVLALGSKEYPESYCTFGHDLNRWLHANQAQSLLDVIEVDNGNPADLEHWYTGLATITGSEVQAVIVEKTYDQWQLISRELLNPNSLGEPAYDIQLKALHAETWHAGDIAEVQCGNGVERIMQFIEQHQLDTTESLVYALRYKDLTSKDLMQSTPIDSKDFAWLEQLPNLPSREYSIASIPEEGYLQLVVRQKQIGENEHGLDTGLGLGSGWLTAYAPNDDNLLLRIRTNPSFHLIDDNRPAIFIGNGTGIAGLMSLLKQREQLGYTQNWLIFGERQIAVDYFYQSQLEAWQQAGHLQHLDVVFSRDTVQNSQLPDQQQQPRYVQHLITAQCDRITQWVADGAVIYICGSIDGMASGVDQALTEILGETQMDQLREEMRYRRDVY